jgi:hypothetical protein
VALVSEHRLLDMVASLVLEVVGRCVTDHAERRLSVSLDSFSAICISKCGLGGKCEKQRDGTYMCLTSSRPVFYVLMLAVEAVSAMLSMPRLTAWLFVAGVFIPTS